MKLIFKSLLLFSTLGFGLEAMAKPQSIEKLQDEAVKIMDSTEFSGSIALVESEGSKDILIDEARAQLTIPISNEVAILLQADARQALGRNLETSADNVDNGQDKLKKALGLSVVFDTNANGTPIMIVAGKFDHVNFPLSSLSPNTAEEDALAIERGATGASFTLTIPDSKYKYIGKTIFQGAILNRSEDRDLNDNYFNTENIGYNVSFSHKFLKNILSMDHTSFNDTAGIEDNASVSISRQLNPKLSAWGRLLLTTDEFEEGNKSTKEILSLGANHEVNSQLAVFGRVDYTDDAQTSSTWEDNSRISVGAIVSPYSKKGPSIGMELYNRQYKNPSIDDETSIRTFFKLSF